MIDVIMHVHRAVNLENEVLNTVGKINPLPARPRVFYFSMANYSSTQLFSALSSMRGAANPRGLSIVNTPIVLACQQQVSAVTLQFPGDMAEIRGRVGTLRAVRELSGRLRA